MGKGIAYQFKLQYPHNFEEYQKACKSGYLRPGKLLYLTERGKVIINFPTKDKWRNDSKVQYIEDGLTELVSLINTLQIKSIAIPPLGSGNGGLIWAKVRPLIEDRLSCLDQSIKIIIYEPSKAYFSRPVQEPNLSTSALILMEIKLCLTKRNRLRLQKATYFMDIFNHKHYFNFVKYKYGPYDHAIELISKNIKAYQDFHGIKSTIKAKEILYKKLVSKSVDIKLAELEPGLKKGCTFVNSISTDHELECLATVCFIIENFQGISEGKIVNEFLNWSADKARRFEENDILLAIGKLYDSEIIDKNLDGFILNWPQA